MNGDPRRALPKMDVVLAHPWITEQMHACGRPLVTEVARRALDLAREGLAEGQPLPSLDDIAQTVTTSVTALTSGRVRAVINTTGVVLHTNLGRAPLSDAAREAVTAAAGYSTVEFDLQTGGRGKRGTTANLLLRELTGAPACLAVNNAAAALLLALNALARDREVVVSRGELVEIGGEFRIPAIMEAAGVKLVEVGSTNRTHLSDYIDAISERTALLMVVHPSNYRIEGFTAQPPLTDLVDLARKTGVPLLHDIGSGLLRGQMGDEPTLEDSLRAEVDLAVFSGDKLFGGPQAGLIVGRSDLVQRLARHPVARAVRIDKLTLAALEATLLSHLSGRLEELPIWRMLNLSPQDLRIRAEQLADGLGRAASLREGAGVVGGGSLPGEHLPSVLVEIDPQPMSETAFVAGLRTADPPVIARAEKGRVLVDLRTVPPEEDARLLRILRDALATDA
ncbi:L-seryl-tRNA(Sec) selenium transferase [Planomonospora parontospora]|uniref:L-seryl-tRNA(Sec) selenium transferase n=1 Tax=Planomonospora parontospora TaxID=58119 RepID=UPI001944E7AF|nr:L-seryl-tRNA(Sec) selenium transferase [Planomonospora parontospora]GII18234.1 L-seryl-tRNA(Sec) selenium transferase [Planomonospora parontospora subsp. antibiotica]